MKASRRLSTNDKLQHFLDQKEYDEDDESHKVKVQNEERRAKEKLWRASLYGSGARAKIPKVKKAKKMIESPYRLMEQDLTLPPKSQVTDTKIPPGAHYDQFRMVQYQTKKCLDDPDRVFYTSTSLRDGVVHTPYQPAWYLGRQNKTEPPDNNIISAASRYGFKGAKSIKQRLSTPYGPPSNTRTEYTPKFLNNGDDIIDEWVPPIQLATFNTINGMETPKLWPENTEYATGYRHKRPPTSYRYSNETTVSMDDRPTTSNGLDEYVDRAKSLNETLRENTKLESAGQRISLTASTKQLFEDIWNDRVSRTANATLRSSMKRIVPPYEAHTLSDASDTLRYSGSTAFIVHTQSTDELKFRLRMQHSNVSMLYDAIWRNSTTQFKTMKARLKRDQNMTSALHELGIKLKIEAKRYGIATQFKRADFIKALLKTPYFEITPPKSLAALFSAFDPLKKNLIRYAEILATWHVIDKPLDPPGAKLKNIFRIYAEYNSDLPLLESALHTFLSACGNEEQRQVMARLYRDEFRQVCYKKAIFDTSKYDAEQAALQNDYNNRQNEGHKTVTFVDDKKNAKGKEVEEEGGSNAAQLQPAYNICLRYLDVNTFSKVLDDCPTIVKQYDEFLSERMVYCYGKDMRYEEEDPLATAEDKDFSWIIGKKKDLTEMFDSF